MAKIELKRTDTGELVFEGESSTVFPRRFLPQLQRTLVAVYGPEVQKSIYKSARAESAEVVRRIADSIVGVLGRLDAKRLSQELLKEFPKRGYGNAELISFDKTSSKFVARIHNCFNCKGIRDTNHVCAISAGLLAGGAFVVTHKEMDAKQTACLAKGDPHCEFEIVPSAVWNI